MGHRNQASELHYVEPAELRPPLQCFADTSRRQEYFLLYSDDIILHGYQGVEPGLESVKQFYNAFWAVFQTHV